ncbi:hypothetical protein ABB37_06103 [Leptomonas pyrrhocoris]|uniref:Uncharacterized protein n=1 Tax=Leptomonas pyrrhocoris TaxID=157538 RepID=A0A0N0DU66_LEPPY|nr:hypothetical protein ABB37_06103 [Leptomonas pyrrhocoris]XP_015656926.1 hypothetical protein ABB37_06103 [Leptomonas pyrrhocoris]XP_015656927.1 hypothetical protein ABB37_06103 [Leptomonas pyrrhocoris]KPA78486.1 hypothetical protein ABB37_06103 [Leptomonas pyrrhocoris]KPA78487.1 hypothetical protein ABB37_06103 [Leptomonas pyrrhocoris]KPA78488.1 hypothetical protein ABB37_06103 [Leptomonas pyrrhocoris]|eukprot:XP_015656925.1 hypothetical protein ABB37_06103 [Leptomonas pyrrhocoris]
MPPKQLPSAKPTRMAGPVSSSRASGSRHGQLVPSTQRGDGRSSNARAMPRVHGAAGGAAASSSALVGGNKPVYGELVESDEVHDEIRALGTEVKSMIAQHLPRHGTSEEQVAWGVRQFGPSKESRAALNKENDAAKLAWERGVYCVWRCTEQPKLRGANNDFCCRLGYRHVCFCGHPMAAHTTPACASNMAATSSSSSSLPNPKFSPVSDRQLAQWKAPCEETGCACAAFRYIPNSPLEIGEGWLTRRANWKPAEWSAKCRCGHGHKAHDPASSSRMRCRSCGGCSGFTSAFLCVVCDLPWEAHETVWESEGAREQAGFPVREAYAPLANFEWDLRELVLTDATMGGKIEPPATYLALRGRENTSSRSPRRRIGGGDGGGPSGVLPPLSSPEMTATPASVPDAAPAVEVEYCAGCATIYRSAASNFCAKCGRPRPRRSTTLR